eukprot:gene29070-32275_t
MMSTVLMQPIELPSTHRDIRDEDIPDKIKHMSSQQIYQWKRNHVKKIKHQVDQDASSSSHEDVLMQSRSCDLPYPLAPTMEQYAHNFPAAHCGRSSYCGDIRSDQSIMQEDVQPVVVPHKGAVVSDVKAVPVSLGAESQPAPTSDNPLLGIFSERARGAVSQGVIATLSDVSSSAEMYRSPEEAKQYMKETDYIFWFARVFDRDSSLFEHWWHYKTPGWPSQPGATPKGGLELWTHIVREQQGQMTTRAFAAFQLACGRPQAVSARSQLDAFAKEDLLTWCSSQYHNDSYRRHQHEIDNPAFIQAILRGQQRDIPYRQLIKIHETSGDSLASVPAPPPGRAQGGLDSLARVQHRSSAPGTFPGVGQEGLGGFDSMACASLAASLARASQQRFSDPGPDFSQEDSYSQHSFVALQNCTSLPILGGLAQGGLSDPSGLSNLLALQATLGHLTGSVAHMAAVGPTYDPQGCYRTHRRQTCGTAHMADLQTTLGQLNSSTTHGAAVQLTRGQQPTRVFLPHACPKQEEGQSAGAINTPAHASAFNTGAISAYGASNPAAPAAATKAHVAVSSPATPPLLTLQQLAFYSPAAANNAPATVSTPATPPLLTLQQLAFYSVKIRFRLQDPFLKAHRKTSRADLVQREMETLDAAVQARPGGWAAVTCVRVLGRNWHEETQP